MSHFAKSLPDSFLRKYRRKSVPWGPVGWVVHKRTYARLTDDDRTEDWWQTVARCCNGILEIGGQFSQHEIESLYDHVFHMRALFAGRQFWQLGTDTIRRIGASSLCNCWCTRVDNPIDPFCFAFNELMLGGGVGFNIQREAVYEMPPVRFAPKVERVDGRDVTFIVPDNREGWVELLRQVLRAFFETGHDFTFSCVCVRGKGEKIQTFGGVASGPDDLANGILKIAEILRKRHLQKLRPVDCLDIMNIIGSIVVSGNVRRSAQLALGDADDLEFMAAKRWDTGVVPSWRAMSNNSVVCNDIQQLPDVFWEGYGGNGEPYGIVNLQNHIDFARSGDVRPDRTVVGLNPCGEISLANYEPCNISDIVLPRVRSHGELMEIAALMYKVNKAITMVKYRDRKTQEIVEQNRRIGIGITGVVEDNGRLMGSLDDVYRHIQDVDNEFSYRNRINRSVRTTTVKPSGTVALLPGVTPGVHPAYSPHYIRRIRFSHNDSLLPHLEAAGYPIEPQVRLDGTLDNGTMVVSFPCTAPDHACSKNFGAVKQLELQAEIQRVWADNSVSCTVYYRKEELPEIKDWLRENYKDRVKAVSFLLHSDHGFRQAPYEEITALQFSEMYSRVRPVGSVSDSGGDADFGECVGGVCPVR